MLGAPGNEDFANKEWGASSGAFVTPGPAEDVPPAPERWTPPPPPWSEHYVEPVDPDELAAEPEPLAPVEIPKPDWSKESEQ